MVLEQGLANPPALLCCRRKLKRHPRKSLPRRIRGRPQSISTSASVGSCEGRRHCSDHLLSTATVFPLSAGLGQGRGGRGVGVGREKSHNLEKDYINHFLCNPFTVPGLVKNCCKHGGHSLTMQLVMTVFSFLNLLIVCGSEKQRWVVEKNSVLGLIGHYIQTLTGHPSDREHSYKKSIVCDSVRSPKMPPSPNHSESSA